MLRNITGGKSLSMRARLSSRQTARRFLILCIAVTCLLTVRADAQGAADMLPQPITTGELVRYMQQLDLSDQQQLAVTSMHDEYKRSYRTLYENEIRDFLDEARSMSGFNIPERDELQDMMRTLNVMEGRIRSLDSRLFDQMQTMLTEDQLAYMPRVRLARNRSTYTQGQMIQMWTMGSPLIDLSAIITDLDLPRSELAAIDPLIARYESNVTSKMARLHNDASSLWLDIYDSIEAAGFDLQELRDMEDMENVDPEQMQKIIETVQQIFMELTAKGRADVHKIRDTNRETVHSFKGLVHEDTYRLLRNSYYARGYPSIGAMTYATPYSLRHVAELPNITDEQRETATEIIRRALQEIDSLVEEAVELTDRFRVSFNVMDFDQEKMKKHQEKMQQLQVKATEIGTTLKTRLRDVLNDEQFQLLAARGTESLKGGEAYNAELLAKTRAAAEAAEMKVAEADAQEYAYLGQSPDQYLPARINRRDLSIYYDLLNATEEQKLIIGGLFDTYLETMKTIEQEQVQQVVEAQSKIWRWDGENEEAARDTRSAEQRLNEVAERRAAAMQAIADADKQFLDDAQLLITDELRLARLERVRQLRKRQRLNTQGMQSYNYGWGNPSHEAQIDVVEFIARQDLDDAARAEIESALIEYENTVLPLFEKRYARAIDFQRTQEMWTIRWQEVQEDEGAGAANAKMMAEYQKTIGSAQQKLSEARKQLAQINSAILDRVLQAATTADTALIRRRYNMLAYPSVYKDGDAVHDYLTPALSLETLAADQKMSLIDLQAEYNPVHEDICQRMLELSRSAPDPNWGGDTDEWRKYQEYQDALQHLQFERTEANSRALLRLRQVLSEQQIEAIGGLPDVAEKSQAQPVYW